MGRNRPTRKVCQESPLGKAAYGSNGKYVRRSVVTVEVDKKLGEFTTISADKTGKVTWKAVDNAVSYTASRISDGNVATSKKVTGTNYKFVTVPKKDFQVFVTAYDASGNTVSSNLITVKV